MVRKRAKEGTRDPDYNIGLFPEGPALILADNGPGIICPPEDILQPFITMKQTEWG